MKRAAYFLVAPALCLAAFWNVLFTWFLNDDFAWLSLRQDVHGLSDLMRALFHPQAQGTVRVVSERLFFLAGVSLFGIHAVPFRVAGLLTWFGCLTLASIIGQKLTGSRAAGLWAAVFWTSSYALVTPLAFSSAYNQLLSSLLLLGAFYARLRWLDSQNRSWLFTEWAAFLIAFGALETAVMYPLAAALYTRFVARRNDRTMWALFVPSAAFLALHAMLIPKNLANIYTIQVDSRLPATLWSYVLWALGPSRLLELNVPEWSFGGLLLTWLIGLALAAFCVIRFRAHDLIPVFGVAWFVLFLAPVLPLPNHVSDYYLTLPLAGLAWTAGWAFRRAWSSGWLLRFGACALAVGFLWGSLYEVSLSTIWYRNRAARMQALFRMVQHSLAAKPAQAILFQGLDNDLFQSGFEDRPFRLAGVDEVYLDLPSSKRLVAREDLGGLARFSMDPGRERQLLAAGQLMVLDVSGSPKEVTAAFLARPRNFVNVGNPDDSARLSGSWYPIENGTRWMGKLAQVELSRPEKGQHLFITGYAPQAALAGGPLQLLVKLDGKLTGSAAISRSEGRFALDFPLDGLPGTGAIAVSLEVSRTFQAPGDPRALGLIFGTFEIR
jgi:hypothetical protein